MKQNRMIKVGLTGDIGSGKTTVANLLKNKGCAIVDADEISRNIITLNEELVEVIRNEFGENFLDENNNLKRKDFAKYIFGNDEIRKQWETQVIPYIINSCFKKINELSNFDIVILDAPTLLEHKLNEKMDVNVLVMSSTENKIKRAMIRSDMTREDVVSRLKTQMNQEKKAKLTNIIIKNNGTLEDLNKEIDILYNKLKGYIVHQ